MNAKGNFVAVATVPKVAVFARKLQKATVSEKGLIAEKLRASAPAAKLSSTAGNWKNAKSFFAIVERGRLGRSAPAASPLRGASIIARAYLAVRGGAAGRGCRSIGVMFG